MSYGDVALAALCCVLFAGAAFSVRGRLRSAAPPPPRPVERVREEDLVLPFVGEDGQPIWASAGEVTWHQIVEQPKPRDTTAKRRAG